MSMITTTRVAMAMDLNSRMDSSSNDNNRNDQHCKKHHHWKIHNNDYRVD